MTSRLVLLASMALSVALAASGCATPQVVTERRPDGILHLKCARALPVCLAEAENLCDHHPYAVLRAFDQHNPKGDTTFPTDFRSSEAFVRCETTVSWGAENKALREQPLLGAAPLTPAVAPPAPARGCMPGATQACVGPGGCGGGQACLTDGAAFGPCDCGVPR